MIQKIHTHTHTKQTAGNGRAEERRNTRAQSVPVLTRSGPCLSLRPFFKNTTQPPPPPPPLLLLFKSARLHIQCAGVHALPFPTLSFRFSVFRRRPWPGPRPFLAHRGCSPARSHTTVSDIHYPYQTPPKRRLLQAYYALYCRFLSYLLWRADDVVVVVVVVVGLFPLGAAAGARPETGGDDAQCVGER